jgi:hypothetical protein
VRGQSNAQRHRQFMKRLNTIASWSHKGCLVLLALAFLLLAVSPEGPAFADTGGPEDPVNGAAGKMLQIFMTLAKLFINIAYALMFIIFAVGSVKSGLGAQAAQQFGATGRVSIELLNLAGGVVIFVFGLMTLPLVNMIIRAVSEQFASGGWEFMIEMPVPIPGGG